MEEWKQPPPEVCVYKVCNDPAERLTLLRYVHDGNFLRVF